MQAQVELAHEFEVVVNKLRQFGPLPSFPKLYEDLKAGKSLPSDAEQEWVLLDVPPSLIAEARAVFQRSAQLDYRELHAKWAEICGTATLQESRNVNVSLADQDVEATVNQLTCSNDAKLGEIHVTVGKRQPHVLRSFDIVGDWQNMQHVYSRFSLSHIIASVLHGTEASEAGLELVTRLQPEELARAARQEVEELVARARSSQGFEARILDSLGQFTPTNAAAQVLLTATSQPTKPSQTQTVDVTKALLRDLLAQSGTHTQELQAISAKVQELEAQRTPDKAALDQIHEQLAALRPQVVSAELVTKEGAHVANVETTPPKQGDALALIKQQLRDLFLSYGTTRAELTQLVNEASRVAALKNPQEARTALLALNQRIHALQQNEMNAAIWPQLDAQLQLAEDSVFRDDVAQAKAATAKIGLLTNMLKMPLPELHAANPPVLVPLKPEDFGVIFDDTRYVFSLCDRPAGHAPLGQGRCLQLQNKDTLVAVACQAHQLHSPIFRDSGSLAQRAASKLDLPSAIHRVHLASAARQPIGAFVAYIPVAEKRPGDELVSAPSLNGFIAVRRAVVPAAAVITITDTAGTDFVFQTV